jgi:glutamate dehydrogenase (NAD(P)+)
VYDAESDGELASRVRDEVDDRGVSWRKAAYVVALSCVAEAHETRGLWP